MHALRCVGRIGIIWIQSKIFEFKNLTTIYVARRAGFEFGGGANGQRQPFLIKILLEYIDGY